MLFPARSNLLPGYGRWLKAGGGRIWRTFVPERVGGQRLVGVCAFPHLRLALLNLLTFFHILSILHDIQQRFSPFFGGFQVLLHKRDIILFDACGVN